jgi:hypothetical protein
MPVTATTTPTVRLPWLGTLWTRTRAAEGVGFKAGWLAVMLGAVVVLAFAGVLWLMLQAARWAFKPGSSKAFALRASPDHGRRVVAHAIARDPCDDMLDGRPWYFYDETDPRRSHQYALNHIDGDE